MKKNIWFCMLVCFLQLIPLKLFADVQLIHSISQVALAHPSPGDEQGFGLPKATQNALRENLLHKKFHAQNEASQRWIYWTLYSVFLGMALCGILPVIVFFIEHNLSGLHVFCSHLKKCKNYCPRVAVIIPAWNEALVLEHTINIFLKIDYPIDALRLYVVDDGSTDKTQEVLSAMQEKFPENVFYLKKEGGGQGKAHAVNYGLHTALLDNWAEAFLLIDADISFKKDALRRLTQHLADPEVGAVTAYIKVGNRDTNYITRSIGYEYIISQAIARRAQNVLGIVACLAGGAQLHSRANILTLGGQIDTSTLAEDTYTTFATQKQGKKVIFEGNSFVYAEEPETITAVWKQRFRWARGNLQITRAYNNFWFHKSFGLGPLFFAILWFCVLLTPVMMILSALGLVGLFVINKDHSSHVFFYLASTSLFVYLYTTIYAILVDRRTARLSWIEGIVYPGLISLSILLISINPELFFRFMSSLLHVHKSRLEDGLLLLMETWSAVCMLCAWVVFRLECAGVSTRITNFLLIIVGYGPLLCAINFTAYIAEIKQPTLKWDKTEKIPVKRVVWPHPQPKEPFDFNKEHIRDLLREYRFFYRQLISLAVVCIIFLLLFR